MLLRREGLCSSHLSEWRKARDSGSLAGGSAAAGTQRKPGRKSAEQVEMAKLKVRAGRAEAELAKSRAALEIVGKAHALTTKARPAPPSPKSRQNDQHRDVVTTTATA